MATEYSAEQHKAVKRVLELSVTDYYGILALEKTCSGGEIKRAYKKHALMMHPDKNKAPQSDEAFKRIAKAFQVLSDEDKRKIFDQTGADPDSRGGGGAGGNPFSPHSAFRSQGFGGQRFQQADPNDIFNMFFGGPNAFGGSPYGAQFQFGDINDIFGTFFQPPRARGQRRSHAQQQNNSEENKRTMWWSLIIIIVLAVLPNLFDIIFGAASTASNIPAFRFTENKPYTHVRYTPKYNVPYFVIPRDIKKLSESKLTTLDKAAENQYLNNLRNQCQNERNKQMSMEREAQGLFFTNKDLLEEARNMKLESCDLLRKLGQRRV